MDTWTLYDNTGLITGYATGSVSSCGDHGMLKGPIYPSDTHYVSFIHGPDPTIQERPAQRTVPDKTDITLGQEVIFANVPPNCTVTIDGVDHTVTDGMLYFDADHVGTYTLQFDSFPYIPATFSITVTEKTDADNGS